MASVTASVAQQDRLRIVTTTADLRSLAKAVGAEQVNVSSLVEPGITVEEYQPKLHDVEILKTAQVVVRTAPAIDPWFDKLLSRVATKYLNPAIERGQPGHIDASLAVAANDPLSVSAGFARGRRASRGGPSPHYWLDPKSAEAITANMVEVFSKFDSKNAKYYENNRKTFLS
ncbi:MAG: metal ABC transporter substrate-binding protein, partial [Pseudorhodoplanes sp.]